MNLYEEAVPTMVENAMQCGKAGGVVTSVPVLHATPGAFVAHSNNRRNTAQLQQSFATVKPTLVSGICQGGFQPSEETKTAMLNGHLSKEWTFLRQGKVGNTQQDGATAENFYDCKCVML